MKNTSSDLAGQDCQPCGHDTARLTGEALRKIHSQLGGGWRVVDENRLEKTFKFPDFGTALQFTDRVGQIAEAQNHHPDIFLSYGEVRLQLSTHRVEGLTGNDFILAAKVNEITRLAPGQA